MTIYHTALETDGVPAPSDWELAPPLTVTVASAACTCDHGHVKAPNSAWENCIKCPEGIELELQRISRRLQGLAERMVEIDALERAGKAQAWHLAEYGGVQHSFTFLCTIHDRLERVQTALKVRL